MSEPLRTDHIRGAPLTEAERQSRIEQLLLDGLDCYFAGRHEEAIQLWSRVAFLERSDRRARAYIERARTAIAEQQRAADELLHDGIAAYQAGQLDAARDLLTRAVEHGGPSDTALVFLQRLSRAAIPSSESARAITGRPDTELPAQVDRRPTDWPLTVLASLAVAAAVAFAALPITSWLSQLPMSAPVTAVVPAEPVAIVRPADRTLDRAAALYTQGRLVEALRLLNGISETDARRVEADVLRGEIQRRLLAGLDAALPADRSTTIAPRTAQEFAR